MKPTAICNGMIADMLEQGQTIDCELAERNTRAVLCAQSVEEEEASRLVDGFQPVYEIPLDIVSRSYSPALTKRQNADDIFFVGWPTMEEDCPNADFGTKCDPVCVYCDMEHVCMDCALKSGSTKASIDPPCPLRIPGCVSCCFFRAMLS